MKKSSIKVPKVSIVFVTWNGKKYTFDLILSLNKIIYKNYDIIVVDNGSTDGTQEEFKKKYLGSKRFTLIENKNNIGLAEGTNVGIREAIKKGSEYILVMNNDMIVDKKFLNILIDSMEKHPEVSVAGPKIYYMEPKNMIWCAGCKYHFTGYKPLEQGNIDHGKKEEERYVDAIDCVLIMKSDIIKKEGLFRKELFFVHELTEWSLRTSNRGFRALYVPESKVWHKVSAAFEGAKTKTETSTYYNIRNWLLVIKKNKSRMYFLGILFLESTVLAIFRLIKWRRIKLIKTYYIAIWHALINKTPMKSYPYK